MTATTTPPDELRKRVESAIRKAETINQKKAAIGGQLQAKKEELAALLQEIRAAGYDPKNLVAERDKARTELIAELDAFEQKLAEAETILNAYDSKR